MTSARITLTIRATRTALRPTYTFSLTVDGQRVGDTQQLSVAEAAALRSLHNQYRSLFARTAGCAATIDAQERALGVALFNVWLGRQWRDVEALAPPSVARVLEIDADPPDLYDLPWSLLRPPTRNFLCRDPRFVICYAPGRLAALQQEPTAAPSGPLRLLINICAPLASDASTQLTTEAELVAATASVDNPIVVDVAEMGTVAEFRHRLHEFQPHMVHLIAEIRLGRYCSRCCTLAAPHLHACSACGTDLTIVTPEPYIAFERPAGGVEWYAATDLRANLAACPSARALYVNPLRSEYAPPLVPLARLCHVITAPAVPLVVGWAQSLDRSAARRFLVQLYQRVAHGDGIDRALAYAGITATADAPAMLPPWPAPMLYTATGYTRVTEGSVPSSATTPVNEQRLSPLPGMAAGTAAPFVGRRREVQAILPDLEQGALRTLIVTGASGAGKSVLATYLARRLAQHNMLPLPVPSTPHVPLSVGRLLYTCAARLQAVAPQATASLFDRTRSISDRLEHLLALFNSHRVVLLLDRFDLNLDHATSRIRDPWLGAFCAELLYRTSAAQRVIITSCAAPTDFMPLPATARIFELQPLSDAAFLSYLARDREVARRLTRGEFSSALLQNLYRSLGASSQFIEQWRSAVRRIPIAELHENSIVGITGTSNIAGTGAGEQTLARLYNELTPSAQQTLRQAAVYDVPVQLDLLAAAQKVSTAQIRADVAACGDQALAMPIAANVWTVPEALRGWLLMATRCTPQEQRSAQQRAGDELARFLRNPRHPRLHVSAFDGWLEARAQYVAATAFDQTLRVTQQIVRVLDRWGLIDDGLQLQQDLHLSEQRQSTAMLRFADAHKRPVEVYG